MKQFLKVSLVILGGVICTGASAQTVAIEVNSYGQLVFPDNGAGSTKEIVFGNQGANDWAIEKWDEGLNFWKLNGQYAGDNRLFLNKYGNVGINSKGTSTDRLYVDGNTRISGGFTTISGIMNFDGILNFSGISHFSGSSYFDGVIRANGFAVYSDKRIKENIHGIETPLTKLTKLKGVQYDLTKSFVSDSSAHVQQKKRDIRKDNIGFLAQDLQKVFPERVLENDSTGLLGINYIGLIPVLVEALKEQQVQIAMLQQQVAVLGAGNDNGNTGGNNGKGKLKSGSADSDTAETEATSASIMLFQNTPNPFSTSTEIAMELPADVQDAKLAIYNLAGEQKLSISVAERGAASVRIEAGQLMPGIYIYGIIADGQLAASKQMVVTE